MKRTQLILILYSIFLTANGQFVTKRYNNWYFGNKAGITFNTRPASPLFDSEMNTLEGCASISDQYGRLLFYTDGSTVWNACHDTMINGTGLYGDNSSIESALITPVISNPNQFYIFTIDGGTTSATAGPKGRWDGLCYSIVDIDSNCNLGKIITKNICLTDSLAEIMTALKHDNGIDYWLVARKHFEDTFYAYKVTSTGVNATPVKSPTKATTNGGFRLIASNDFNNILYSTTSPNLVISYNFDRTTGVITLQDTVNNSNIIPISIAYSPNDSLIYVSSVTRIVYRFDRFALGMPKIDSFIFDSLGQPNVDIKKGPDGKIYINKVGFNKISIVPNPNDKDSFIVWEDTLDVVNIVGLNLPNFFNYWSPEDTSLIPPEETFKYVMNDTILDTCQGEVRALGLPTPNSCYNYIWSSGNMVSDSTVPEPTTSIPGIYAVKMTYRCIDYFDTVIVFQKNNATNVSPNTSICKGDSIPLFANGGIGYRWIPGSNLTDSLIQLPLARPPDSITYAVVIYKGINCNSDTLYTNIAVNLTPITSVSNDTAICPYDMITLTATGGDIYSWSPIVGLGSPNKSMTLASPVNSTTYFVNVRDTSTNCSTVDSVKVDIVTTTNQGDCFLIFIPNVFSPNGDGDNDVFRIRSTGIKKLLIKIYDRWGKLVYESTDTNEGWGGKYKSKEANKGVYVYHITGQFIGNENFEYKGNVTLIR